MTDDDIPEGWYPDSEGTIRWWDGAQWTEHVQRSAGAAESTVVLPATRTQASVRRDETTDDDEPDHKRRTWLVATVVGLLTFFLGMAIGGAGSPEAEVPIADEIASSGATAQDLDQREAELEQRDAALTSKEAELTDRERDVAAREQDLGGGEPDSGAADTIGNGTFEIGAEVQPGQYLSAGPQDADDSACSYQVSNDEAGESIVTSEESDGQAEVFLEEGQYFQSENCLPWERQ